MAERGLAGRRSDGIERPDGTDQADDLVRGDDVVEPPAVRLPDVHVLDEPERYVAAAEPLGERDDAVIVDAALDDGVHLHPQTRGDSCVDAVEDALDGEVDVVQRTEHRIVDRVETDVDASQARVRERLRLLCQQRAVRRQGDVERRDRREHLDEVLEVAAQQRLTAGQAHGAHAEPREHAGHPRDLLQRQQLSALEEHVVAAERALRHAVDAAEVAPVRDRDPQRLQRPTEGVLHQAAGSSSASANVCARATASSCEWTPSASRIAWMWLRTVVSDSRSRAAIWRARTPSASRQRIWRWRLVSAGCGSTATSSTSSAASWSVWRTLGLVRAVAADDDRRHDEPPRPRVRPHVRREAPHRPAVPREPRRRAAGVAEERAVVVPARDHVPARPPHGLARRDAGQSLGCRVPIGDPAVRVGTEDRRPRTDLRHPKTLAALAVTAIRRGHDGGCGHPARRRG